MLAPAAEATMEVVRAGERASPPVAAPRPLRKHLRFSRLPRAAANQIRRVLDGDDELRARVAAAVDEATVGRPAWLWLARPPGWADELARFAAAEAGERAVADRDRSARDAERRRSGAEAARARAEARAEEAGRSLGELREELAAERRARGRAESDLGRVRTELEEVRTALHESESLAADERDAAGTLRAELEQVRAELAEARTALGGEVAAQPDHGGEDGREGAALDRRGLARAVGDAATAAEHLSRALSDAARLLGRDVATGTAAGGAPARTGSSGYRRGSPAPSRRPAALPGGVVDGSPEAAAHLVRLNGVVVLVDGYNVSKEAWPEESPARQRERLVALLEGLAARTGADVQLVFDGVGDEPTSATAARSPVRVSFTPARREADDELLALVEAAPRSRPVVVVSSDRRVRDGAEAAGANVVPSEVFLQVARMS